ncbi:hypothetical protein MRX96_039204 [Rhipicephalus microplus]
MLQQQRLARAARRPSLSPGPMFFGSGYTTSLRMVDSIGFPELVPIGEELTSFGRSVDHTSVGERYRDFDDVVVASEIPARVLPSRSPASRQMHERKIGRGVSGCRRSDSRWLCRVGEQLEARFLGVFQ